MKRRKPQANEKAEHEANRLLRGFDEKAQAMEVEPKPICALVSWRGEMVFGWYLLLCPDISTEIVVFVEEARVTSEIAEGLKRQRPGLSKIRAADFLSMGQPVENAGTFRLCGNRLRGLTEEQLKAVLKLKLPIFEGSAASLYLKPDGGSKRPN